MTGVEAIYQEKLSAAINYVTQNLDQKFNGKKDLDTVINDAANIFGDNYTIYCKLSGDLESYFYWDFEGVLNNRSES